MQLCSGPNSISLGLPTFAILFAPPVRHNACSSLLNIINRREGESLADPHSPPAGPMLVVRGITNNTTKHRACTRTRTLDTGDTFNAHTCNNVLVRLRRAVFIRTELISSLVLNRWVESIDRWLKRKPLQGLFTEMHCSLVGEISTEQA